MKFILPLLSAVTLLTACAQTPVATDIHSPPTAGAIAEKNFASPSLEGYTQTVLFNDLWKRTEMSPRDRSIVTLSALISRNDTSELAYHFNLALTNGVNPAEISEIITHLAFYSGWGNATSAVGYASAAFKARGVQASELPSLQGPRLALDEQAEARRNARVGQDAGPASPGLVKFTADALFKDLWLRPGLAPRDRSLVTFSSLVTTGQVAQIPFHLNRAMDNGLTKAEAQEALTQLAFYAGWPNVFTAVPVVKEVFAKRPA